MSEWSSRHSSRPAMPGPWMPQKGQAAGSSPAETRRRASSISSVNACRTLITTTRSAPLSRQPWTTAATWWPQSRTPACGKTATPPEASAGARSHSRPRSSRSSVPRSPSASCSARYSSWICSFSRARSRAMARACQRRALVSTGAPRSVAGGRRRSAAPPTVRRHALRARPASGTARPQATRTVGRVRVVAVPAGKTASGDVGCPARTGSPRLPCHLGPVAGLLGTRASAGVRHESQLRSHERPRRSRPREHKEMHRAGGDLVRLPD